MSVGVQHILTPGAGVDVLPLAVQTVTIPMVNVLLGIGDAKDETVQEKLVVLPTVVYGGFGVPYP